MIRNSGQAGISINASRRGNNLIITASQSLAGYGTLNSFIDYIFNGAPDKITAMARRCRIIINSPDAGTGTKVTVNNGGAFNGGREAMPDELIDGISSFLFIDFFRQAERGGGTDTGAEQVSGPVGASIDYSGIKFGIEYEDDFLAVINKPAGVKIHSDGTGASDSLSDAVDNYFWKAFYGARAYPVHRLDIGTSGLIVYAKDNITCAILDRAIFENRLRRRYTAVIEGAPAAREGSINLAIGRDRHNSNRYRVSKTGKTAVTGYKIIKTDRRRNISFIEATLESGRTHQIRVHFSHIGHPLAGDKLYGGRPLKSCGFFAPAGAAGTEREFLLHSSYLYFIHPYSKKTIELNSPPDFM